ncbi:phosphatidylethanolamine-binding protein, partial [Mycena leptocephala]
ACDVTPLFDTSLRPEPPYCSSILATALTKVRIIPDIHGSFQPLSALTFLTIILPSGPVSLSTVEPPGIAIAAVPSDEDVGADGLVKNETRYTVAMFDPDAPSAASPTSSQFRHWVITGLTPTGDPTARVPHQLRTPIATAPAEGQRDSSIHLRPLPRTPELHPPSELESTIEARRCWDAAKFGERNGLRMVGTAFYLVRGED